VFYHNVILGDPSRDVLRVFEINWLKRYLSQFELVDGAFMQRSVSEKRTGSDFNSVL
jgi:hypothetical protein